MKKRIAIVDDQTIFREMLREILAQEVGLLVVGSFATALDAERELPDLAPDLVIVDLVLPDDSGLQLCARLRKKLPRTRLLMVTAHERPEIGPQAERAGANGLVRKGATLTELKNAVRSTLTLGSHFDHRGRNDAPEAEGELSPREKQVLILIAHGLRTKEIAVRLALSERTVENHRQNLRTKLGIRDVAGLIRYAAERGLVEWSSP
jgi:two-component system, NarL family, nitrate/nitrite response regulator NarL